VLLRPPVPENPAAQSSTGAVDRHHPTTWLTQSPGSMLAVMIDMHIIKGIAIAVLFWLSVIGVGLLLRILS
jgi:hypothetical protein